MPNTGTTETPDILTFSRSRLVKEDEDRWHRESLLSLLARSERLDKFAGDQPSLGRAQYNTFQNQPIAIGASANTEIKKGHTVVERPVHSMTLSSVLDDPVKSPG